MSAKQFLIALYDDENETKKYIHILHFAAANSRGEFVSSEYMHAAFFHYFFLYLLINFSFWVFFSCLIHSIRMKL